MICLSMIITTIITIIFFLSLAKTRAHFNEEYANVVDYKKIEMICKHTHITSNMNDVE